jgi:hypothetical protein
MASGLRRKVDLDLAGRRRVGVEELNRRHLANTFQGDLGLQLAGYWLTDGCLNSRSLAVPLSSAPLTVSAPLKVVVFALDWIGAAISFAYTPAREVGNRFWNDSRRGRTSRPRQLSSGELRRLRR